MRTILMTKVAAHFGFDPLTVYDWRRRGLLTAFQPKLTSGWQKVSQQEGAFLVFAFMLREAGLEISPAMHMARYLSRHKRRRPKPFPLRQGISVSLDQRVVDLVFVHLRMLEEEAA